MTTSPFADPHGAEWHMEWGGEKFFAPSAFDLLAQVGERSYAPLDHKYPKRGIAYRVFVQYRVLIDEELPDEIFLTRLAEFGIISLTVTGKLPNDVLQEALNFAELWYGNPETKEI
jgi:hypothetical protein